ncbi:S-layer homology domain-containing protein [Paenibacillus sp. UNC496MF]|uniref:S-layer homology domain-containing protein n=1 Tax=Paenibacillus sp. UNC496MF TaxID=1502753 RepID=UPI0008E39450|nr:S-layer homology domain-containing protein [Paenibacillus sp. UNC496MF]SFI91281.1 S-layer homology domain-containing protein [Paenibacillus sp. UNC496MF]
MKRKAALLAALALSLAVPASIPAAAFAAEASINATAGTTIDAIASLAQGGTVTISGTTNAQEVIIKVLNPDGTILFFDAVKASEGKYRDSFALSSNAAVGSYQVVAGQGTDVSTATFSVTSNNGTVNIPPVTPPVDPAAQQVRFTTSDVSAPANGIATLDASKPAAANLQILFPPAVGQTVGDNSLRIALAGGSVTLPKEVLAALGELTGTDGDASFALNVRALSADEAASAVAGAAGAGLSPQGQAYELSLSVVLKDGTSKKLENFAKPVELQLRLTADANARLAGIYYLTGAGAVEYVGGTVKDGVITADVSHFSKYGVFSYLKTYKDVPASYWAADVIQELTAKHVVEGVSADAFGPKTNVTRAEFATMLVRALNLKASKAAPFSDVPAGSWYADTVAAAFENGIVTGTGGGRFEPSKAITRQEMAIMIVNVYEKRSGSAAGGIASDLAGFKDAAAVSGWAKEAVQDAVHAGLMTGSDDRFTPRSNAIRAEAAKVLYNLLFA